MKAMKVLIVGGTGFIGRHVVDSLIDKGYEVTVLHRGQNRDLLNPEAKTLIGDRENLTSLAPALKSLAADIVIDMIPKTAEEIWSLLNFSRGFSKQLIVVSSIDVYRAYNMLRKAEPGEPGPEKICEDAPLRERLYPYRSNAVDSLSPAYLYEKIIVERLALAESELISTVLRLPVVYGPRDKQNRVFDYLKRMDDGRPAILLGKTQARWRLTRGFVEDVARAVADSATANPQHDGVYNLGEEECLDERQWVMEIAQAAGWKGQILEVPDEALPEHLNQDFDWRHDLSIDTSKFNRDFGYCQSDRAEALKRTIDWQRANPPEVIDPLRYDYQSEDRTLESFTNLAGSASKS